MDHQAAIQFRWIEAHELDTRFTPAPFPPRPCRAPLGPLASSMRDLGCISPILARPLGDRLQVVCGYRRLLAAQAVGLDALPVLVRPLTDEECWRFFADENSRREPREGRRLGLGGSAEAAIGREMGTPAGRHASGPPRLVAPLPPAKSAQPERLVQHIEEAMAHLLLRAEAYFASIRETHRIPVEEVEALAADLIRLAPVHHGTDLRGFIAPGSPDWLPGHSLLVAGLGVHLAASLGWTQGQVKKFALACLLHDTGMLFIPRQFLNVQGPLEPAQRELVERHTEIGKEVIQASRAFGVQIPLVARDHHERWDGSGYPGKRKGKEVDLPARIVGFLDCFSAMVGERPHRPALLYSRALRAIAAETEAGLHDPSILVRFRQVFTDLPVGSCLRLPDGRLGRVVETDPLHPRRHRVRILAEEGGGEEPVWIESDALHSHEVPPPGAVPLEEPGAGRLGLDRATGGAPALEPTAAS